MENNIVHPDDIRKMKRFLDDYLRIKGKALRQKNTYYCLCHSETTPSLKTFWVNNNPEQGIRKAKCFSCGRAFDIYDIVGILEGVEGLKAQYYRLCEVLGQSSAEGQILSMKQEVESKNKPTIEEVARYVASCDQMQGLYYWQQRGLGEMTIKTYGLTYDSQKNALVIPVTKQGYILRYLNHSKYRYIKSLGLNEYFKSITMDSKLPIVLTEGEIDALSVIEADYPNVIALGSISNLINIYEAFVTSKTKEIIIAVDLDEAGQKWTQSLLNTCKAMNWRKPINLWEYIPLELQRQCKDLNDLLLKDKATLSECLALVKEAYGG